MADHSIEGKVVLIAGGAKNLVGLIARDLAAQGAKAIHYNSASSQADADATVAAIQARKPWRCRRISPQQVPSRSCLPTPSAL